MTIIDVRDGGHAFAEKYNVTIGVIHLIVQDGESKPEKIIGYCWPEEKETNIKMLKRIVWEQPT